MSGTMTDLVVIGGGLAGLSAGARAAEMGLGVTVLEQGEEEHYPCNSRYAGGILHLAFLDVGLPPAELEAALRRKLPGDVDAELVATIARRVGPTVEWLRKVAGAKFIRAGEEAWLKWCLAPPRPIRTSLVWPGRGPDVVVRGLGATLQARGGRLQRGARATDVQRLPGGGFRVAFERGGRAEQLLARAVVLADGGFQASAADLAAHVTPTPEALVQRNARTGRGLGLAVARRLGARLSALDRFYGHLLSIDAHHDDRLWPYPVLDDLATAGMVVDQNGARFLDEGRGGVFMTNEIARRGGALRPFVVADATLWETAGRITRIPCNPLLTDNGGTVFRGATLAEAAAAAGVDAAGLAATVAAHNAALAAGRMPENRTASVHGPKPIATAPFLLIPAAAGITYTMGGVAIDTQAAVQSADGGSIPGLYAAGATTGDAEGGEPAFYLGGLCKAAVLGKLAGESAAAWLAGSAPRLAAAGD
jgi:fumarate reductase flavoprotein subunit